MTEETKKIDLKDFLQSTEAKEIFTSVIKKHYKKKMWDKIKKDNIDENDPRLESVVIYARENEPDLIFGYIKKSDNMSYDEIQSSLHLVSEKESEEKNVKFEYLHQPDREMHILARHIAPRLYRIDLRSFVALLKSVLSDSQGTGRISDFWNESSVEYYKIDGYKIKDKTSSENYVYIMV